MYTYQTVFSHLKQGSERKSFVVKQGQGLKAYAAHLCQNFRGFVSSLKFHIYLEQRPQSHICKNITLNIDSEAAHLPSVYVAACSHVERNLLCATCCCCSCIMTPRNLLFVLFTRYYCLNLPKKCQ